MAKTPAYKSEKRKKELSRKKKQEEKKLKRQKSNPQNRISGHDSPGGRE